MSFGSTFSIIECFSKNSLPHGNSLDTGNNISQQTIDIEIRFFHKTHSYDDKILGRDDKYVLTLVSVCREQISGHIGIVSSGILPSEVLVGVDT